MSHRSIVVAALLSGMMVTSAAAQERSGASGGPWLVGGSIGVPGHAEDAVPRLWTVGFHATRGEPGRIGPDLSAGIMPHLIADGSLVFGARADLTLPVALGPGVLTLPSAGLSFMGGFSGGDGEAEAGLNVGFAMVVTGGSPPGFRTGITWHRFRGFDESVWLIEVGLMGR